MKVGATILGHEADQLCGLRPIDRVVDEAAGAMCGQQPASGQCVQVMRQGRAGHLDPVLDLVHAGSLRPGAHQHAEDREPVFMPQGAELFDVPIHYDLSSIIEI